MCAIQLGIRGRARLGAVRVFPAVIGAPAIMEDRGS